MLHDFDEENPSGYTEEERFDQCLEYHRALIFDYSRRWRDDSSSSTAWPRNIPSASEIPALEMDLRFCRSSPNYRNNTPTCQNQQFRIASYYLTQTLSEEDQMVGYRLVKDLAEHGHADGMCLYGMSAFVAWCRVLLPFACLSPPTLSHTAMILNDGRVAGIDANPEESVVWFRRCVDLHRHVTATYELAICLYTGDGVVENPESAVKLFRQAAHLGHAGAAYMLGECLLDGVGSKRDRASALEWLVTAAELGHGLARERVMVVLQQDHDAVDAATIAAGRHTEAIKWVSEQNAEMVANLERRHTVGGGSRNPEVSARRRTKVAESRSSTLAAATTTAV